VLPYRITIEEQLNVDTFLKEQLKCGHDRGRALPYRITIEEQLNVDTALEEQPNVGTTVEERPFRAAYQPHQSGL